MKSVWKLVLGTLLIVLGLVFLHDVFYFLAYYLPIWQEFEAFIRIDRSIDREWIEAFIRITLPTELVGWVGGGCLLFSWRRDNEAEDA